MLICVDLPRLIVGFLDAATIDHSGCFQLLQSYFFIVFYMIATSVCIEFRLKPYRPPAAEALAKDVDTFDCGFLGGEAAIVFDFPRDEAVDDCVGLLDLAWLGVLSSLQFDIPFHNFWRHHTNVVLEHVTLSTRRCPRQRQNAKMKTLMKIES